MSENYCFIITGDIVLLFVCFLVCLFVISIFCEFDKRITSYYTSNVVLMGYLLFTVTGADVKLNRLGMNKANLKVFGMSA